MYKFILSFVFIMSSTLLGCWFSQKLTNRKRTLEMLIDSINKTKTLITFGGYEISRVITESFGPIRGFSMVSELSNNDESFYELFYKCVDSLPSAYFLCTEDKELLKRFAEGLGVSDIQGQTLNCDLYSELFKEQLKIAKEKEKASGRLYRIMGFSLGCAVTLMIV